MTEPIMKTTPEGKHVTETLHAHFDEKGRRIVMSDNTSRSETLDEGLRVIKNTTNEHGDPSPTNQTTETQIVGSRCLPERCTIL